MWNYKYNILATAAASEEWVLLVRNGELWIFIHTCAYMCTCTRARVTTSKMILVVLWQILIFSDSQLSLIVALVREGGGVLWCCASNTAFSVCSVPSGVQPFRGGKEGPHPVCQQCATHHGRVSAPSVFSWPPDCLSLHITQHSFLPAVFLLSAAKNKKANSIRKMGSCKN